MKKNKDAISIEIEGNVMKIFYRNIILLLTLLILAVFVSNFGDAGGGVKVLAAEELQGLSVPTININPDIYYPFDEILYIEGRARPNTAVEIQFAKQGVKPGKFNAKSDPNGEWVLAEKIPLEAGDWEVRARAVTDKNQVSEWSNPRVFKVIVSGITIGGINLKFALLSLIIIVLLIIGAATALYFTWRVRRLKAILVSKEVHEAHQSVREGISEIRRDLLDELRHIESSKGLLSDAERSKKEHILKELDNLERGMEREIQDIEKY